MLRELRLTNLAVIEKTALEFDAGFTVLTGETGAGKSLLVGALNLILGARASADLIRTGAEEAAVEAAFEGGDAPRIKSVLEEAGLPVEETLIVRRVIARSGKNRIYINGAMAPLGTLSAVGELLLGILGQREHHSLLRAETHRELLDAYAGNELLLSKMGEAYGKWQEAKEALAALSTDEEERLKRVDYLKYLTQELKDAAPKEGEEETLEDEHKKLANAEKIAQAAGGGYETLYEGEGAVAERLAAVSERLGALASLDEGLGGAARLLGEAVPLVEEAARALQETARRFGDDAEGLEGRLNEVQERLDLLTRLKRKHGVQTLADLISLSEKLFEELEALENYDSQLAARRKAEEAARRDASDAAKALHTSRAKAAKALGKDVGRELEALNMKSATLEVGVEETGEVALHGSDRIEFRFSPNPGEAAKPLIKIASGGELSRVLLALRLVLTEPGRVRTLVLDEVDAGVGGVTADIIGRKIRQLAESFQVICITHLPQIACRARRHIRVAKEIEKNRTRTTVSLLDEEARVEEISRMLGGESVTEKVRATARELLTQAGG